MKKVIVFLLFLSLSFSVPLQVVEPVNQSVTENDTVYLGTIGPGQTIEVKIDPVVHEGGIYGRGGWYDKARAENLPIGWDSSSTLLYENPQQVTLTADPRAEPGNYTAKIRVIDEKNADELGNKTFHVKVGIKRDVLDFKVKPKRQVVGISQPADFDAFIRNKGSASDVFRINYTGAQEIQSKDVFVPANSTKVVNYRLVGDEEENYRSKVNVVSKSSPIIHDSENITLVVKPTLLGDYQATNNGLLIFPVFEIFLHSLAGLIYNFISLISNLVFLLVLFI